LPLDYPTRHYLLSGVKQGFNVVDIQDLPDSTNRVEMDNYTSVTNGKLTTMVEAQIISEIEHGHYVITSQKRLITSALGAIAKKSGRSVRLIHDASRPPGGAVNDYAQGDPFQYQTLQDAIDQITPNGYLAKCDLSQAYRVVPVHPSNYTALGLKYTFKGDSEPTYMLDTRLPFGCKLSPQIFNALTQAVRSIMASKGFPNITVYLDDFLICEKSYERCHETLQVLLKLLRDLGFYINYSKLEGPVQRLTFLGITLDTRNMTMELPPDKLLDLHNCLIKTKNAAKLTKRQLQSLAGKLSWCTQVIYGGRFHLRRLLDRIKMLNKPWHRSRITKAMLQDIDFWLFWLPHFNGCMSMVDVRPLTPVYLDACNISLGAYYDNDWIYTPLDQCWPTARPLHINHKEVLALEPAATRWGHLWANHKVTIHTDNQAAASMIHRGSSNHPLVMDSLRRVFWLSVLFNFRIHAVYICGSMNKMADQISRLHEPGGIQRLHALQMDLIRGRYSLCRCETCPGAKPGPTGDYLQEQQILQKHPPNV